MKSFVFGLATVVLCTFGYIEKPSAGYSSIPDPENTAAEKFQKEFLDRINKIRAKGCDCGDTYMPPAPPLAWNLQLELAAFNHAEDMSKNKYFAHISKNGNTIKDRITAAGYTYNGFQSFIIGENIAWGQRSIKEVMEGWLNSEGHCKNLMKQEYKEVGIVRYNSYWVQDFGGRTPFPKKNRRLF